MKHLRLLLIGVSTMTAFSATAWAQETHYPITVIPPGKGPYTFAEGY